MISFAQDKSVTKESVDEKATTTHFIDLVVDRPLDTAILIRLLPSPFTTSTTSEFTLPRREFYLPKGMGPGSKYSVAVNIHSDAEKEQTEQILLVLQIDAAFAKFATIGLLSQHTIEIEDGGSSVGTAAPTQASTLPAPSSQNEGTTASPAAVKVSVEFADSSSTIQEVFDTSGVTVHTVSLLVLDTVRKAVTYVVERSAASSTDITDFVENRWSVVIPKGTPKGAKIPIRLLLSKDTLVEGNEVQALTLKVSAESADDAKISGKNTHRIIVYDGKQQDNFFMQPEFRIDIGTNFDFLDGIDATGLYTNVIAFQPNLFRISKRKSIGLYTGIRRSRPLSDSTRLENRPLSRIATIPELNTDTTIALERTAMNIRTVNPSYDITTVYINPIVGLWESKNASMYIGIDLSTTRRKLSFNQIADTVGVDTIFARTYRGTGTRQALELQAGKKVYFDFSYGIKLPIRYKIDNIKLEVIPSIGFATSEVTPIMYAGTYFNVIELKSGLNLGGEIQAFFGGRNKITEPNSDAFYPVINIYLSKAFDIRALSRYQQ